MRRDATEGEVLPLIADERPGVAGFEVGEADLRVLAAGAGGDGEPRGVQEVDAAGRTISADRAVTDCVEPVRRGRPPRRPRARRRGRSRPRRAELLRRGPAGRVVAVGGEAHDLAAVSATSVAPSEPQAMRSTPASVTALPVVDADADLLVVDGGQRPGHRGRRAPVPASDSGSGSRPGSASRRTAARRARTRRASPSHAGSESPASALRRKCRSCGRVDPDALGVGDRQRAQTVERQRRLGVGGSRLRRPVSAPCPAQRARPSRPCRSRPLTGCGGACRATVPLTRVAVRRAELELGLAQRGLRLVEVHALEVRDAWSARGRRRRRARSSRRASRRCRVRAPATTAPISRRRRAWRVCCSGVCVKPARAVASWAALKVSPVSAGIVAVSGRVRM